MVGVSNVPVIYKANFTGSNFLHNYDDEAVIILLLQGGDTPLIEAASSGHHNIVRLLLSEGADPNKPDRVSNELSTCNGHSQKF